MNEKLLIDNWSYYDEVNKLLIHTLCKDGRKSISEKLDFYYEHRHTREYDEDTLTVDDVIEMQRNDDSFQNLVKIYKHRQFMAELANEDKTGKIGWNPVYTMKTKEIRQVERYLERENWDYDSQIEDIFTNKTDYFQRNNISLRQKNEVHIYKSDIDVINQIRKEHKLTAHEVQVIFGLIFWCRMFDTAEVFLLSCEPDDFKIKQFNGCFQKAINDNKLFKLIRWDLKLHETIFKHDIKTNKYYYSNFDNKDEIVYTFKTTLENNRLNLTKVAQEALDFKLKYCEICGKEIHAHSNRQKMCDECKAEVTKEQARLRKQRQRERQRGK
jgi:hypothetical protein